MNDPVPPSWERAVLEKVALKALEEQGKVDLVSQPNLLIGNNLPAVIQAGNPFPIAGGILINQAELNWRFIYN